MNKSAGPCDLGCIASLLCTCEPANFAAVDLLRSRYVEQIVQRFVEASDGTKEYNEKTPAQVRASPWPSRVCPIRFHRVFPRERDCVHACRHTLRHARRSAYKKHLGGSQHPGVSWSAREHSPSCHLRPAQTPRRCRLLLQSGRTPKTIKQPVATHTTTHQHDALARPSEPCLKPSAASRECARVRARFPEMTHTKRDPQHSNACQ